MRLKFLSWNVHGLNDRGKRVLIRSLLRNAKAEVVCLQETKMDCIDGEVVRELWGGHFVDWNHLPAIGVARGVLVCWDRRLVVKEEEEMGDLSMCCLFHCVEDDFRWVFTGMYGPVRGSERFLFLGRVAKYRIVFGPWIWEDKGKRCVKPYIFHSHFTYQISFPFQISS